MESKQFNKYVTPTQRISRRSTDVTKFTEVNGQLYHDGKAVNTISIKETLTEFINFLKTFPNPVFIGHNIKAFDLIFLYNNLVKYELWETFVSIVVGFVDTLLIFKKEFPKRKSYKQEVLLSELMDKTYSAHNVLNDVKALQELLELVKSTLPKNIFNLSMIVNSVNAETQKATLKPVEDCKAISKTMACKIAKNGLNYNHLKIAFERNGFDGLVVVLREKVNGIARVTKQGKIIQKIYQHFSQL